MGWWIFWLIVVAVIAFCVVKLGEEREHEAEERRAHREVYEAAKADFLSREIGEAETHVVKLDGRETILLTPDDAAVRLIQMSSPTTDFDVLLDQTIPLKNIRHASFEQEDVVQTFTRKIVTPVAVQKKKSAVGRGLVGGLLLGPVGLVLGAASGVSPSTKVVEHTTTQTDQRVVKGPPMLVLTTKDRANPFVRIEFEKADDAKAWALWIQDQLPTA